MIKTYCMGKNKNKKQTNKKPRQGGWGGGYNLPASGQEPLHRVACHLLVGFGNTREPRKAYVLWDWNLPLARKWSGVPRK